MQKETNRVKSRAKRAAPASIRRAHAGESEAGDRESGPVGGTVGESLTRNSCGSINLGRVRFTRRTGKRVLPYRRANETSQPKSLLLRRIAVMLRRESPVSCAAALAVRS